MASLPSPKACLLTRARSAVFLAAVLVAACGGTAENSGSQGTGGSASGGFASGGSAAGGGGTGGAAIGGTSSGGASTGGGSVGGSGGAQITGACQVDSDCVAVMNTADPCYSGSCSAPIAASLPDVAQNNCLIPWAEREGDIPANCLSDADVGCPALCAIQPECVMPRCDAGTCTLDARYSPDECQSTADPCAQLDAERRATLEAARTCNAAIEIAQCTGTEVIAHECGCDILVNEAQPEKVAAARAARDAWEAAGCGPSACPAVECAPVTGGGCVAMSLGDFCVPN